MEPTWLDAVESALVEYVRAVRHSATASRAHLAGAGAVASLENKLRAHYGKRHALCVSSATAGLDAVTEALGLRRREVVAPALAWGGTIGSCLRAGADVRFADVDDVTLGLCAQSTVRALTRRTRAIVAIDFHGVPVDHVALREAADQHGLWYIHDAAQSVGAKRDALPAGARAHVIAVSFTCGKTLACGEGGAVLTDDDDLYQRLVWSTQHPDRQKRDVRLTVNSLARNHRIHPLAAVWADADFDSALERLARRQTRSMAIVHELNACGLTEPLDFRALRAEPAFFDLTAAWKQRPAPEAVKDALHRGGFDVHVESAGLRCAFDDIVVREFATSEVRATRCPVASRQSARRFRVCLVGGDGAE